MFERLLSSFLSTVGNMSWYKKPQRQQSADTAEQKSALGKDEKDASITDPSTVKLQSGVFKTVTRICMQLCSHKRSHLTQNQAEARVGRTTVGELGVLHQEQDAQYNAFLHRTN
ncbi:hypothetical protein ACHAPE_002752 [Trichoderma viride]